MLRRMNIVLFEDSLVDRLYPITLSRPAYAVTCGAWRLVDLARSLAEPGRLTGRVRPFVQEVQRDFLPSSGRFDPRLRTLWLNARLVPAASLLEKLEQMMLSDGSLQAMVHDQVAVAVTPAGVEWDGLSPLSTEEKIELDVGLLQRPHDVVVQHAQVMGEQLALIVQNSDYQEVCDDVFTRGVTRIHEHVVFDTENGPVVVEDGVTIEPFVVIKGPARIGRGSYIAPHTHVKGPVAVGEQCKIGGEISRSVVESYSNKVHFGYLGSAYVGSWVNLGAGTTNSNLKNTYGKIRVAYDNASIETGMQFFGCIIGDYTKTAIHTSIYTGKILGVCSNVYGTVTTNVPSFANYARSFGDTTEQPAEVMEVTQRRIFARRGIEQQDRHRQLIRAMYEIESPKRELANHPPAL